MDSPTPIIICLAIRKNSKQASKENQRSPTKVIHGCHASSFEAEAGFLQAQSHHRLHIETLHPEQEVRWKDGSVDNKLALLTGGPDFRSSEPTFKAGPDDILLYSIRRARGT